MHRSYAEDFTVHAVTCRCAQLTRLWWAEKTSRRANIIDTFYDFERQDRASMENKQVAERRLPNKKNIVVLCEK